jgi:hypothetical protein
MPEAIAVRTNEPVQTTSDVTNRPMICPFDSKRNQSVLQFPTLQ